MSSVVETRSMKAEFDNKDFEKNIHQTMQSLDSFEKSLSSLGGQSVAGIEKLQNSFNTLNSKVSILADTGEFIQKRFSVMGSAIYGILNNIVNKAADAGEKLIKSLSVDNISAGWEKFAENTKNIGTIVSQGYSMNDVEKEMKRLMFFTDETSYSYSEMVNNISKFTATGKSLHDSVDAMQGIALWAGSAGVNAQKTSMAMYQLSQALGAGYMRKEDWKSIQNYNMDIKEFREMALEAGVAAGTLKKSADGMYESLINPKAGKFDSSQFAEHLTNDKWFTDEVMMSVYKRYNEAVQQIYDYVQKNNVTTAQAIEELSGELDPLAIKWFKASQEARTFGDAIDYVKEAVSTGWMRTFELIFGNYEEATKLWTDLSDTLYTVFVEMNDVRNGILEVWKAFGGREYLLIAIEAAFNAISNVVKAVRTGIERVFEPLEESDAAKRLFEITDSLVDFFYDLQLTEEASQTIADIFEGLASVVKLVINGFKALTNALKPMLAPVKSVLNFLFQFLGSIGRAISSLVKWLETSSKGIKMTETLANIVAKALVVFLAYRTIPRIFNSITTAIKATSTVLLLTPTKILGTVNAIKAGLSGIVAFLPIILKVGAAAAIAVGAFLLIKTAVENWAKIVDFARTKFEQFRDFISGFAPTVQSAIGGIPKLFDDVKNRVTTFADSFLKSFDFGAAVDKTRKKLEEFVKSVGSIGKLRFGSVRTGIQGALTNVFTRFKQLPKIIQNATTRAKGFFNVRDTESGLSRAITKVSEAFNSVKDFLGRIGSSIADFFSRVVKGFSNIKSFDDLKKKVSDLVGSFKGLDTVTGLIGKLGEALTNLGTRVTPKFGNLGTVLGNMLVRMGSVFTTIKDKFDFTKLFDTILNGFKTFGLIIGGVITNIIPALRRGAEAIGLFHTQTRASASGALDVATMFQQVASRISASLSDIYEIIQKNGGLIQMFVDALAAGFNRLKQAVDSFLKQTGMDVYVNQLITWLEPMLQYVGKLEPAQLILLAFGISVAKMAANTSKAVITVSNSVSDFLKTAKAVPETLTGIFKEISSTVKTFGDFLKAVPTTLTTIFNDLKKALRARNLAKDFLRVALGISALALSLGFLAKYVDPIKLAQVSVVIFMLAAGLAALTSWMGGLKTKSMLSIAVVMVSMATTISILAAAVWLLAKIPVDAFMTGITMLGIITFGLLKALEILQFAQISNVGSIVGLCIGLAVAFDALALGIGALTIVMSLSSPDAIAGAIAALSIFLIGVAGIVALTSKIPPTAALSIIPIIGIVMSLYLLMGAIILIAMSPISPDMIAKNLEKYAIVFGALAIVIVVANKLSSSLKSFGLAIIGISVALGLLVKVVKQISEIDFSGIGNYIASMGVFGNVLAALLFLMIFSKAVSKAAIRGAVALMGITLSLRIMMFTMSAIKQLIETASPIKIAGILVIETIMVALLRSLMVSSAFTRYAKVGPILALIAALGLMTVALTLISLLPLPQIGKMIGIALGLGTFFYLMGRCFEMIAQASFYSNKATIMAFSVIVVAIVGALIYLTTVPWQQVIAAGAALFLAGIGIGAGLLMIANAAKIAKDSLGGALAIMATALALIPAAMALSQLATFEPDRVMAAALGLGVIMTAIAVAANIADEAIFGAMALLVASISLVPAAMALQQLQGFKGPEIIDAAFALGLVLVMVAAGAAVASQAIVGAAALFVASLSLVGASDALTALAAIDPNALTAAVNALVNVLMTLAVAGLISSIPLATFGLIGLSAALVVLALAFNGIADASLKFAMAMSTIVMNLTMLASMSDETVTRIINNMMMLGSGLGEGIGNAIVVAFDKVYQSIDQSATKISARIDELVTEIAGKKERMEWAGMEICAGAVSGIEKNKGSVIEAMRQMAEESCEAFQNVVGVHSESDRFRWILTECCNGSVSGINQGSPDVEAAMRQMGQNVLGEASSIFSYENGAGIASVLVAGIKDTIARGIAEARHMLADFNAMAQASSMDPEVAKKGKVYLNARAAAKTQERMERDMEKDRKKRDADRQARLKKQGEAAVADQERLEKELGYNQPKDPFEELFGDDPGGGSGGSSGSGGSGTEKATEEAKKQIDKFTNIMDYASDAVNLFKNNYASAKTELSDTQQFQASKNAVELLALKLYEQSIASETAEEAAERMGKTQAEVAADIKKAYQDMEKGVEETLKSQLKMYEMFESKPALKGGEMAKNIQSNYDALKGWNNLLDQLSKRLEGVEGGLEIYNDLVKQGIESTPQIKGWLDMTDEEFTKSIENINNMPDNIRFAANNAMSGAANIAYSMSDSFKEVLNTEEGSATGGVYGNAVLDGLRTSLLGGGNLQGADAAPVKEIAETVAETMKEALDPKTGDAKDATTEAGTLGEEVANAVGDSASTQSGVQIGVDLVKGIAAGIRDAASEAYGAAAEIGLGLVTVMKQTLGINSPSRAFMELGYYSDLGLAQGFSKYGSVVREAAAESALGALDEMSGVFGRIADIVDGNIDLDPTIRPVLDLTNLQYGATQIGSLLGLNDPYAIQATAGLSGIQNDASLMANLTGSLTNAINGMKKDQEIPPVTINIYPQEGQSAEQIAEEVSWRLNHDVFKRRAVYGGT